MRKTKPRKRPADAKTPSPDFDDDEQWDNIGSGWAVEPFDLNKVTNALSGMQQQHKRVSNALSQAIKKHGPAHELVQFLSRMIDNIEEYIKENGERLARMAPACCIDG